MHTLETNVCIHWVYNVGKWLITREDSFVATARKEFEYTIKTIYSQKMYVYS